MEKLSAVPTNTSFLWHLSRSFGLFIVCCFTCSTGFILCQTLTPFVQRHKLQQQNENIKKSVGTHLVAFYTFLFALNRNDFQFYYPSTF